MCDMYDVTTVMPLDGMVLWQELKYVSLLSDSWRRRQTAFQCETIRNTLYVKTSTITDPVLRSTALCCQDLTSYYPFQQFLSDFCNGDESYQKIVHNELKESGRLVELYNILFVKMDQDLLESTTIKGAVINAIEVEHEDIDGYNQVFSFTPSLSIGVWY
jgi:hypothetical protein